MRLIDGDALMETANDTFNMVGNTCVLMNAKDFVRNLIDNQPTICPVKHGKWKERIVDDEERMVYCSVCGDEYAEQGIDLASWVKDFFNYCPNCGARMDGET